MSFQIPNNQRIEEVLFNALDEVQLEVLGKVLLDVLDKVRLEVQNYLYFMT